MNDMAATKAAGRHVFTRLRHPLVARQLQVKRVTAITPKMRRITLAGADLLGFYSPSADDHVKLFIPAPGESRPRMPSFGDDAPSLVEGGPFSPARDYTPRRHDAQAGELDIDFVLHGDGPAALWAAQAQPGQWIGVGGPRGSQVAPDDFDSYLLAGDETALPSIARRLESLPAGASVTAVIEIADAAEEQKLAGNADVRRLHRGEHAPGALLEQALASLPIPAGDCYVWVATESRRAQAIRERLIARGQPEPWLKTVGYWKRELDRS